MSQRTHNGRHGDQRTEREFVWPAIWALVVLGAACIIMGLAGCAEGGRSLTPNGTVAPFRSFASNQASEFVCKQTYDPATGIITQEVAVRDNITPNDHALDVIGNLGTAAIGKIPSPVPAAPMGARPGARADAVPANPLNAAACLGLHFASDAGDPPNPMPPGWGQAQQDDPVDHGSQPELMRAPERRQ